MLVAKSVRQQPRPRHSSSSTHSPAFDISGLATDFLASLCLTQLKDVSPTRDSLEVEARDKLEAPAQDFTKKPDTELAVHIQ
jgi:hypothetical protein